MAEKILDTFVNEVQFKLTGTGLEDSKRGVKELEREVDVFGVSLFKLRNLAVTAFGAFIAGDIIRRSIEAFSAESKAAAILEQSVKNVGTSLGATSEQLSDFADKLQSKIGISDEQIIKTFAYLLILDFAEKIP